MSPSRKSTAHSARTHRLLRPREPTLRFNVILDSLGIVLMLFSGAFLIPLLAVWYYHESWVLATEAYVGPFAMCLVMGLVLRYSTHNLYQNMRSGETMVLVSLAWLVLALMGTIPYVEIGVTNSLVDGFFESMSGFTSTGATVLSGLDRMPHSILLWRALTQWFGGMGVIVLSVAVLSRFFGAGTKPLLMQAEMPGPTVTRMAPRMAQTARLLWGIYILLTVSEVCLLLAVGHIGPRRIGTFDAICQSLTTLPGGGFGTHDSNIGYWNSSGIEFIIVIFMLAGATSFVLHHKALHGNLRSYLRDGEFRFYLIVIALAIVIVTGNLASKHIYSVGTSFRYGSFQVVSVLTTTGFTTTDFGLWPYSSQVLLVILMLFGGCLGSTSGALKITRVLVILKSIRLMMSKALHRRGVFHVRLGDAVLSYEQVAYTATYVLLYAGIIALGTLLMTFEGVEPISSVSATITCIGNVGPGLGLVGPGTTFAALPALSKVTLAVIMWLGRLEILGCMLLFSPRALLD